MSKPQGRARGAQTAPGTAILKALPGPATGTVGSLPVAGLDEAVWYDVIHRMDEVYSELLRNEVELERKHRELEESHRFVFSVLSAMSDVLIVCDRRGLVRQANQAMLRLAGRSEPDLVGSSLLDLLADVASRERIAGFLKSTQDDVLLDCEVQFAAAGGAPVPVATNGSVLRDVKQRRQGIVLIGRPVGDLRRAYRQLSEAHETLKTTQQQLIQIEKMASLGQLVAGVAHELNNPISFVLGNVHALQRYLRRLESYIERLHGGAGAAEMHSLRAELRIDHLISDLGPLIAGTLEGAERTRDIIDSLGRFSAADRGEEVEFDLVEVIERAVNWVCKAMPRTFTVRRTLPVALPMRGSPGQMQQVIINLVQNAYDAAPARKPPVLEITAQPGGDGLMEISFRDHGSGISPEHIGKVFDPFFTTKPIGKGTGLGLSVSYGIVERHGGRIRVANHRGGGAIFTLQLPRHGGTAPPG